MIKVEDLVFDYGDFRALDGISFELPQGKIIALVGHNGAGKTTLFKCLSGLVQPTSGWVSIDGVSRPHLIKSKIGFLQDFIGVYEELSVTQCLEYFGRAYRLSESQIQKRIPELAQELQLGSFLNKKAGDLSRGMKQRLAIAQSIIHKPKLLLLDEPASGLDPQSRIQLAELFLSLKSMGITLLVSSHILSELDQYADELLILDGGVILQDQAPAEETHTFQLKSLSDPQTALSELGEIEVKEVELISTSPYTLKFSARWEPQEQAFFLSKLVNAEIGLLEFNRVKKGLQEDYLDRVGKQSSLSQKGDADVA